MATKTFVPGTVVDSPWLNDVDAAVYEILGDGTNPAATKAAARTNLGLGSIATQNANSVAITGGTIANTTLTTPTITNPTITGGSITGITDLAVADGGTGDSGTAWTSSAVAITASSGAFTNANASVRYKQLGKTLFICITATIITNGTAAGAVRVALPAGITVVGGTAEQCLSGRENQATGVAVVGTTTAGGSIVSIVKYDNTYPGGNGYRIVVEGVLETA